MTDAEAPDPSPSNAPSGSSGPPGRARAPTPVRVAAFVSPHGFGHAARSSSVLEALDRLHGAEIALFTTAPKWFFEESLPSSFRYHEVEVDVGFRQRSALEVDLAATVSAVRQLVPFDASLVDRLAEQLRAARSEVVLCDIASLGVAVAERAALPSVLVENFTWRWLYEPFFDEAPTLREAGDELQRWVERATVRLQARPVCERLPDHELVDPISRPPRRDREASRRVLGIEGGRRLVVLTMGGYGEALPFLDRLRAVPGIDFLVTGVERTGIDGNLRLFDNNSPLFMPDVLRAADAVVAKLGYGTVSEVWREGIPFGWVTRPDSREMAALEAFAERELPGFLLERDAFVGGGWIDRLPELLSMPRRPRSGGGADRVAEVLAEQTGRSAV
jgi:hypothetical protein